MSSYYGMKSYHHLNGIKTRRIRGSTVFWFMVFTTDLLIILLIVLCAVDRRVSEAVVNLLLGPI